MPRKTPEQLRDVLRDFRRDQVIDVARRLFGERGSTDVSMEEIATEAGVARSTVYVYFATRDELLRACLERMHTQLLDGLAAAWEEGAEPEDRLRTLFDGVFELIDDNPAFFRLAVVAEDAVAVTADAVQRGTSPSTPGLALIGLNIARLIQDLYDEGVAAGRFRAMDPLVATALIGQMLFGAMSIRAGDPAPGPRDEAAAVVCDFVLHGLGSMPAEG
ncbi:MAG: TetR/AcrR family transcriptional regulator [Actinomycetota bacterium]|jgi:TetR/AcrR family fatty acid metabolism transcriptional regulator|nr:TetR/AcrR family transcriptional regulator [Actinomycetota bacterium]